MTLAHREVANRGGDDRQQSEGTHQPKQRDQHKTAEHHPDDAAEGVERHHLTDITPDMFAPDTQAQRHGKRRAEQHGRHEHDAQCGHRKAYAHAQQFTGTQ
ncbi:hypothetical protein D3C76_841520 [compost metagenome]